MQSQGDSYTKEELQEQTVDAIALLARNYSSGDAISKQTVADTLNGLSIPELFYEPTDKLKERLKDYVKWVADRNINENTGNLMEELALLAFMSVKGMQNISSYRSYDNQLDLVVSGSDESSWFAFVTYLHLPPEKRTIVVEAKNRETRINSNEFLRLCGILQNKFIGQCQLGIFFSRNGATGFSRRQSLSEARATQTLFHLESGGKYVVVLDHDDLLELGRPGAFPRILERKIREIEEAKGLPIPDTDGFHEVLLPPHLMQHWEEVELDSPSVEAGTRHNDISEKQEKNSKNA